MGRLEQDYREALDSLRFSDAGKERILENLMEHRAERPVKRRGGRPLRVALIAAAVCLALVGTVFAIGPENWVSFICQSRGSDGDEMFSIDSGALTRYSRDELAVEYEGSGRVRSNHPTWEDAEEYLGVDMPMSRAMEELGSQRTFRVYPDSHGDSYETYDCMVEVTDKQITTGVDYRMEQWYTCSVSTFLLTDQAEPDQTPLWIAQGEDIVSTVFKRYVTPSGLETGIIGDHNSYWAAFTLNGIGYYVRLSWNNTPIADTLEAEVRGLELLGQVLDGFVLE